VDLFFNPRSAWLLKLAGVPLRIGGTAKSRGRLYTHRALRGDLARDYQGFATVAPGGLGEHLCRLAPLRHRETGLDFAAWLLDTFEPGELMPDLGAGPSLTPLPQALADLGLGAREPFLLLAPCATWESKQWPRARWEELVAVLVEATDLPLAVMVAPGKMDAWGGLARLIPRGRGGVLPPLPLPQALAVTASAKALVTVDGGIMHAAVGLDVPTLALFGPTDPAIWFPYEQSGPFHVLARAPHCHPCDLQECPAFICLPELDALTVWRTLALLLAGLETQEELP
jgi:ADP-heptose:LPS heptosyltransferase